MHLALIHVTITQIASTFQVTSDVNVKLASLVVAVMISMNVVKIRIDVTIMQIAQIPLVLISVHVKRDLLVMVLNVKILMNVPQVITIVLHTVDVPMTMVFMYAHVLMVTSMTQHLPV